MAAHLKLSIAFRATIVKLLEKIHDKTLQKVAFIYDMDKHYLEREEGINGFTLFQDLICDGKLEHSDGELIAQFNEVLKTLERSDLAKLLTDYCSKYDICYEAPHNSKENLDPVPSQTSGAPKPSLLTSSGQEEHVSTTGEGDTDGSSTDEPQKIEGSVLLIKEKKAGKSRARVNSGSSGPATKKRKKLDRGAMDEGEMMEENYQGDGDEEPVGPHDAQDEQYMRDAMDEAKQSPDEDVQVGTVIVNRGQGKVLGRGHNRMPKGCDKLPWSDDCHNLLGSKYPYVFHSSKAALKDAFRQNMDLEGATLYTTLFPANTDAQWIAECGIKELVYLEDPYKQRKFAIAAKTIFDTRGITYRRMDRSDLNRTTGCIVQL